MSSAMMKIKFEPVPLVTITDALTQHLTNLPSPVEGFFESHIEEANHYHILIDGDVAGYTTIHSGNLVTQFHLYDPFKRYGQPIFQRIKKLESVRRAFAPTCDEFFLSHALDENRHFEFQAYFFQSDDNEIRAIDDPVFSFRQASEDDSDLIQQLSGDFFEPIAEQLGKGELFMTYKGDECVGIGVMIQNKFCMGYAGIGMFTVETSRNRGVGTATIRFLMQECRRNAMRPVAGCGYYNHLSKRTLEKAGMYSQTRLLKIHY